MKIWLYCLTCKNNVLREMTTCTCYRCYNCGGELISLSELYGKRKLTEKYDWNGKIDRFC